MPGPSPAFLADMWAPFAAGEQLAGYGKPSAAPVVSGGMLAPAAPPIMAAPPPAAPAPPVAPMGPPPPPPPPPAPAQPHEDPNALMSHAPPVASQGPAPAPPIEPPRQAPPPPMPPDVQFTAVGGGSSPAREVSIRGPQQEAYLERSYEHPLAAADRMDLRSQMQAEREEVLYEQQAEQHLKRQEAMSRVSERRNAEMQALRSDYLDTVGKLGEMKLDNNRLWANASTGDKLGAIALVMLGSALGGPNNVVLKALEQQMDADVQLQKTMYERGLDVAKGQQTAYAMAMESYGSEDAATNAAQAASRDYMTAKLGALQAQWKGTDAANKADELRAHFAMDSDQMKAKGLMFLQPGRGSPKYMMTIRGQQIPGLVDEKTAQTYAVQHGVAPSERVDEITTKGGIELAVENRKQHASLAGKVDEGAGKISSQLQQAGVPQARAAADAALKALNKSPGGSGDAATRWFLGNDVLANTVMPDDSNAREQAYWAFANASMKAMMGNVTESEMARAQKQLGSASDPESRRRAIAATLDTLSEIEKNAKAGASPAAQAEFDRRRETAKGDKPAAPPSANQGWK